MPTNQRKLRRDASGTRKAILASARRAFARAGYEGVGVREIAKGAGVTAMLINRYFGSKEGLFAEVVAETMAIPSIITPEILSSPDCGERLAAALVEHTKEGISPLDGFLIMLHSTSSKRAARISREQTERYHQKALAGALKGDLAPQRAALMLSMIAGFQVMRQMIGLSDLTKAAPEALAKILGQIFHHLIDGEVCERDNAMSPPLRNRGRI
jgi:AcrR family transcriptional regulator